MIGKVSSTGSFGKTYRYAHRAQANTQATVIGGNLAEVGVDASAITPEELSQHHAEACEAFEIQRAIAPPGSRAETECNHWVVSYAPGEDPSNDQAQEHAESFIAGMILLSERPELAENPEAFQAARDEFKRDRLDNFQYSIIRHHDRDHAHSHIVMGRRDLETGMVVSNYHDRFRAQQVCEALEREFDLVKVERGPKSKTEKDYYQATGEILEPTIRQLWEDAGRARDFELETQLNGQSYKLKYQPPTERQPERISLYSGDKSTGKTKPLLSVYVGADKGSHNNKLDFDQAKLLRDRLLALKKRQKKLMQQEATLQQQRLEQQQQTRQHQPERKKRDKDKAMER